MNSGPKAVFISRNKPVFGYTDYCFLYNNSLLVLVFSTLKDKFTQDFFLRRVFDWYQHVTGFEHFLNSQFKPFSRTLRYLNQRSLSSQLNCNNRCKYKFRIQQTNMMSTLFNCNIIVTAKGAKQGTSWPEVSYCFYITVTMCGDVLVIDLKVLLMHWLGIILTKKQDLLAVYK